MHALSLRFASPVSHPDLPLEVGMHHIGRLEEEGGSLGVVDEPRSIVCLCVDRRGVWLTVGEGRDGVHVNGRDVRRLAMLRVGDAVYVDGQELRLVAGRRPSAPLPPPPRAAEPDAAPDPRIVLRAIGGRHHGRSFTLDVPRLVGRAPDADIRIDDPAFADHHARIELAGGQVRLRDLGSEEGSQVNGEYVRDALLAPGDQVVFDAHHRFVIEAPMRDGVQGPLLLEDLLEEDEQMPAADAGAVRASHPLWRLPWLLLAALLIAGLLSLLLLYGAG